MDVVITNADSPTMWPECQTGIRKGGFRVRQGERELTHVAYLLFEIHPLCVVYVGVVHAEEGREEAERQLNGCGQLFWQRLVSIFPELFLVTYEEDSDYCERHDSTTLFDAFVGSLESCFGFYYRCLLLFQGQKAFKLFFGLGLGLWFSLLLS